MLDPFQPSAEALIPSRELYSLTKNLNIEFQKYFPGQVVPTTAKARQSFHKQLDKEFLSNPEFTFIYEDLVENTDLR